MIKIFYKDESATNPGKWLIRMNMEDFHTDWTTGSYQVLPARLFGISYANYLRMCRDHFGAEIIGKGSMYPVAYFKNGDGINSIIALLNARAEYILWIREHPEHEEHLKFVNEKNPNFVATRAPGLKEGVNG